MRRSLLAILFPVGLMTAAPAAAALVVGTFTADVIAINGDDELAPPQFTTSTTLTGRFGYDTDAAVDADPDPNRGDYVFDSTAFVSVTANGATYTTDPSLGPVTIRLGRFDGVGGGSGSQFFTIRGGLVPQAQLGVATAPFRLEIELVNGLSGDPFVPSDALPTADFSLAAFSDPDGRLGGGTATPYSVIFQLRSLDIETEAVPEPAALGLLGLGVVGLALRRRRAGRARP